MDISDIGSTDVTSLLCITNRPPPSGSPNSGGDWYTPDGTRVDGTGVPGFSTTRGPMVVRLMTNTSTDPAAEGIYHCSIEVATLITYYISVGLYNSGEGMHHKLCCLCN